MNSKENHIPEVSARLFGLDKKLTMLANLYKLKKFPKVLMLTGDKGVGKFTLACHFLHFVFDQENYDLKDNIINNKTDFHLKYQNNIYPSIIYLSGQNFNNIKTDDIRDLKSTIFKKNILERDRFIILDDIELFNINSLNALLKTIEEPTDNNYFLLINNKTKPLIETIYSRSIEIKILLTKQDKKQIIEALKKENNFKFSFDLDNFDLTPGNFLLYNKICEDHNLDFKENYLGNLKILLNFYKKNKDINFIKLCIFITEIYFNDLIQTDKVVDKEILFQNKDFVLNNINNFTLYNLNQNSLINAINNKLSYG